MRKLPQVPGVCHFVASWRSFVAGGEQRRDTMDPGGPAHHTSVGLHFNPRCSFPCPRKAHVASYTPVTGERGRWLRPAASEEHTKTEWPEHTEGQRFAPRWRTKGRTGKKSSDVSTKMALRFLSSVSSVVSRIKTQL